MRILVADDDAGTRLALQATLRGSGHEVVAVVDGESAWDLLQKPDAPKLAVLDWMMPKLDGLEVIRRARAAFPGDPVYCIVLTSHDGKEHLVRALEAGADDYLVKPANPRELRARIQVGARLVQLQAMLLKEQYHLHSLMDNLPLAIYFKDRHSRFTRINKEQARRLGLADPGQAIGKTDHDFFGLEHAAQALEDERQIIRTGQPLVEMEEKENWPDGTVTWVASTKMPLRERGGEITGTFGVSRDITKRKRAEEAAGFLASIVESTDDAIVGVRLDGTIASWNRGAQSLYGYQAAEMVGRSESLLIPADRPDELWQILQALKQGERILHFETERLRQDGRRVPVSLTISPIKDAQVTPAGAAVIARDITARKRAENELHQSRQMLQVILDSIPQRVFWKDRNIRYLGCNRAFAMDAGLRDAAEIVGKSDFDLAWRETAELYRADDKLVMDQESPKLNFEERQTKPDGSLLWLQTNKMPLRGREGEVIGVLGTYEDITQRKQAEEALRASENRYRLLFEHNLAGVLRCTPEGRILSCNESLARTLGYVSARELSGHNAMDLWDDPGDWERILDRVRDSLGLSNCELRFRHKNGGPVWVIANITPIEEEAGQSRCMELTLVDITDRKRAEEALAEEARLAALRAEVGGVLVRAGTLRSGLQESAESLVRGTGVAFARIWTLNESAPALVLEASAGMYTHIDGAHRLVPLGHFKVGKIAQDRLPHLSNEVRNDPEVADHEWARREGLASFVGHPLVVEDRVVGVLAAFGRRPLTGATLLAFSSAADQIAQFIHGKRATEALQRSEERARLLFAAIPHPAYVFDLDTLDFLEVNDIAVEHYGYSRDEFLHMKTTDIRPAEEIERLKEHLRQVRSLKEAAAGQWKHRAKDGRIIDVEINFHAVDYDGHRAALTIAQDVTKRKQLEMDLRHAQKLEAVGGLAAGIAHEINTPIQFVGDNLRFLEDAFGSLRGLLRKYQNLAEAARTGGLDATLIEEVDRAAEEADLEYLTEEIPKALSQSLEGTCRVAAIVKAMKDFAHPERSEKAATDLNKALATTLVVAHNELKYVADVETDFGDLPPVECHLGDLNQVFLNLLVNAAHAVEDVVKGTGRKGAIRIRTRREGDRVRIAISDTGCGIPEPIRGKVFEPFFTTKGVGRGTGQGLAISRSIVVDKHGGTLTFTSEVGRGSTFVIGLPVLCPTRIH